MKRNELAAKLADEVGDYVADQFRADIGSEKKDDGTYVTSADREAEYKIRTAIREAFPDDSIIGEEHDDEEGTSDITWYIDPIDGTTNFVHGIPLFGVSIGYADGEGPLGAAISLPMLNSLYTATRGNGAEMNGAPISIAKTWDKERPVITLAVSNRDDKRIGKLFAHRPRPKIRVFGSVVVVLSLFAEGGAQGAFLLDMNPWDYAAGILIAREAGAYIGTLDNKPPKLPNVASFFLTAEENADAFRELLNN